MLKRITIILIVAGASFAQDSTSYNAFRDFCDTTFVRSVDSSLYDTYFGSDFEIGTVWARPSRNSITIGAKTNHHALVRVAYGTTQSYGDTVDVDDSYYLTHVGYITGLTASTEYYYKVLATSAQDSTDEATGSVSTVSGSGWTEIPGGLSGPPYTLDTQDETYVFTEDVASDTRGIILAASGITIELNGYTLSYDNDTPLVDDSWAVERSVNYSSYGIAGNGDAGSYTANLYGGVIQQGAQQSAGEASSANTKSPVYWRGGAAWDIAGVTIEWGGNNVSGALLHAGDGEVRWSIFCDLGDTITNRSSGQTHALTSENEGYDNADDCGNRPFDLDNLPSHNDITAKNVLVKRTRQSGITGIVLADSCEWYVDSWTTNSNGIAPWENSTIKNCAAFGTGHDAVAYAYFLGDYTDSLVYDTNFAHMVTDTIRHGTATTDGNDSSVKIYRVTQYEGGCRTYQGYRYRDCVSLVELTKGGKYARGFEVGSSPYTSDMVVSGCTVKINTHDLDDGNTARAAAVYLHGSGSDDSNNGRVEYYNNEFIGNDILISPGDYYATGGRFYFRDNTWTLYGEGGVTVRPQLYERDCTYNWFIDNTFTGGAGLDNTNDYYDWDYGVSTGYDLEVGVGHTVYITCQDTNSSPLADQQIILSDAQSWADTVTTDSEGLGRFSVVEYHWANASDVDNSQTYIAHSGWELSLDGGTVSLDPGDEEITDNAGNPLVYSLAGGSGGPVALAISTAAADGSTVSIGWNDTGATVYQLIVADQGDEIFHYAGADTAVEFPYAASDALDVRVRADGGAWVRTGISAQ